jgi:hypothetical protein
MSARKLVHAMRSGGREPRRPRIRRLHARLILALFVALVSGLSGPRLAPDIAHAASGDFVGAVNFSQQCASGLGVGIAYDGANLWYTCYASTTDLLRADPHTGQVTASYSIAAGLGAIAYDITRNVIWAAPGGGISGAIYKIVLNASKNVVSSSIAFNAGSDAQTLTDGIAFDGSDDTLYFKPDTVQVIHHYTTAGTKLADLPGPPDPSDFCLNFGVSGLALGGTMLYEGRDGCSRIYVVDKATNALQFTFSTIVAGDPNFRDEGLTCDPNTFAAQGKQVMWSKEAYTPMRAHAYEIPTGSCAVGGTGVPSSCNVIAKVRGPYYINGTYTAEPSIDAQISKTVGGLHRELFASPLGSANVQNAQTTSCTGVGTATASATFTGTAYGGSGAYTQGDVVTTTLADSSPTTITEVTDIWNAAHTILKGHSVGIYNVGPNSYLTTS